jgi:hypothetical protein
MSPPLFAYPNYQLDFWYPGDARPFGLPVQVVWLLWRAGRAFLQLSLLVVPTAGSQKGESWRLSE